MKLPHPSKFDNALTDENLGFFANQILDVYDQTVQDLSRPEDDNYTFGTSLFGRTKNKLNNLIVEDKCPINVKIIDGSNRFIFLMGQSECRFFNDNFLAPKKRGAFVRSEQLDLFAIDASQPVFWNFVVQSTSVEDEPPRIIFAGYDLYHNLASVWEHNSTRSHLSLVDEFITPDAVEFDEPYPEDPDQDQDDDAVNSSKDS